MNDTIEYSKMDIRAMFARYNAEAEVRGVSVMTKPPEDRMTMGKALALLMATPKPKVPKTSPDVSPRVRRNNEIRAIVVEELCRISHHESDAPGGKLIPCGFSYTAVLAAVKLRLPTSKMTGPKLRVHAANIRTHKPGYEAAKLPDRRPHSRKGTKTNG